MINQLGVLVRSSAIIAGLCFSYQAPMLEARKSAPTILPQDTSDLKNETQKEAARLWEQAIAAKGGRERLYAVQSMVISQVATYKKKRFSLPATYEAYPRERNQVRSEALYVFPNKFWDYEDYRPDIFGVTMHMYNYDTGIKYVLTLGEPHHPLEPIEPNEKRESRTHGLVAYLLETTWLKPIPIKASKARIGLRPIDLVQTTLNGERVDFALNPNTHFPVEVRYYSTFNDKTHVTIERLSDYAEVSGIKVPQSVTADDGTKYTGTVQFNVEYNPDIFIKPPPLEAGPEAWRRKGNR